MNWVDLLLIFLLISQLCHRQFSQIVEVIKTVHRQINTNYLKMGLKFAKNLFKGTQARLVNKNKKLLMIDAYKNFWTKAFDFNGISNRSEYWFAVLANFLVYLTLAIFTGLATGVNDSLAGLLACIYFLYAFGQIIPGLSVTIRRVRDMGKGWQWIFINLIPIMGGIWFLIILCQPSIPNA